ncbi:helix-turn-helix domain-containing protein [Pacificibacter marinus]
MHALSLSEREEISRSLCLKHSLCKIARQLGRYLRQRD